MAVSLGSLGTGRFSDVGGVNAAGTIVGSSYTDGGSFMGIHAFRYDDANGMVDLTPTADNASAQGINASGQIAGYRESRAFRLTGTTFTDLGLAGGFGASFGFAINNSGQVAGHLTSASGNPQKIVRHTDGVGMVILGGLGEHNVASGINSQGDIVGSGKPTVDFLQGFVYTDATGMRGLNSLIDPGSGWFINNASGINDASQIAASGSGPTDQHALRLVPNTGGPVLTPATPTAMGGTRLGPGRIRVNWTDNAGNETRFRIERATGTTGAFVLLSQVGANVRQFTDRSVNGQTLYRYRVRAENAAGPSGWSNTVTVR